MGQRRTRQILIAKNFTSAETQLARFTACTEFNDAALQSVDSLNGLASTKDESSGWELKLITIPIIGEEINRRW